MPSYTLGEEIIRDGKRFRVVRIIKDSETLCDEGGGPFVLKESYIQLRAEDGEPDFTILNEEAVPYSGPESEIKGLPVPPGRI